MDQVKEDSKISVRVYAEGTILLNLTSVGHLNTSETFAGDITKSLTFNSILGLEDE